MLGCDFDTVKNKFKMSNDGEGVGIDGVDEKDLIYYANNNLDEFDNTKIKILRLK